MVPVRCHEARLERGGAHDRREWLYGVVLQSNT